MAEADIQGHVVSAAERPTVVSIRTLMADVSCGSAHGPHCQRIGLRNFAANGIGTAT